MDLYFGDKLEPCEHRRDPTDRCNNGNAVVTVRKHHGGLWGGATALGNETVLRNLGNRGAGSQNQA
jgi:hypothetical protein